MKTYQYNKSDKVYWVAAEDQETADAYAKRRRWAQCGGEIFDAAKTAELLSDGVEGRSAGVDVVLP